jgi:hypothetical protein
MRIARRAFSCNDLDATISAKRSGSRGRETAYPAVRKELVESALDASEG